MPETCAITQHQYPIYVSQYPSWGALITLFPGKEIEAQKDKQPVEVHTAKKY